MSVETGTLMQETIRLLRERTNQLPQIAQKTGLSFYWLRKFAYREIPNPSVNAVQKLYEYLADKKLSVEVDRSDIDFRHE
jgi:transcriptional regulator with XRE-family HTH domain